MKTKLAGLLLLLLIGVAACKYDDDALWNKLNSLEERIVSLESKLSQMNADINSISTIVNALEKKIFISKVEETEDGYKITFTDEKEITFNIDKDGKDTPVISISKENGVYYWVQIINGTKSWLTDEKGNKIPVSGEEAITPILKVSAKGNWLVSYDRGVTFKEILDENGQTVKAVGEDGKDGSDGTNGSDGSNVDSFFTSVRVEKNELILTLKDGMMLRVPINKGDKPENSEDYVLNEKVNQLTTEDEKAYIQAFIPDQNGTSGNNTIVYALNTPKEKLPKEGGIILYNEITETFPSGFLGKVISLEKKEGAIYVRTAPAALDEAFDKLSFEQTMDLEPIGQPSLRSSVLGKDEDGFFISQLPITLKSETESGTAASITGAVKLGFKLYIHVELDKEANKSWAFVTLQTKNILETSTNIFFEGERELLRKEIGPEIPFKILPAAIVVTPTVQVYGIVKVDGTIGVNSVFSFSNQTVSGIEYKDGQWGVGSNTIKTKDGPFMAKFNPETQISLDGTLFGGVSVEAKIKLFNNDNMKIALEPNLGLYEKAELLLDLTSQDFYETLKDSKVSAGLRLGLRAKANAGIFKKEDGEWTFPIVEEDFEFKSSYLFPSFEQKDLQVDNKNKSVSVSYNVSNDVMFDSEVGVSLFKGGKEEQRSSPGSYIFEKDYKNPLIAIFNSLNTDTEYAVNPYIKWGDWVIPATPSHSFQLEKEEEVDSGKDPSKTILVTSEIASGLQKDATTLSGSVTGIFISEVDSYGFIYTLSGAPSVDNGTVVSCNEFLDGQFKATISGLEEEKTYYWCAFVKKNGIYYYGENKIFLINKTIVSENVRKILIQLYDATGGENWIHKGNWKTDQPIETWHGVSVQNGLIHLDLSNNNLTAGFNLTDCADFAEINLSGNRIEFFCIENLGALAKADFSNCQIMNFFRAQTNDKLCDLILAGCNSLTNIQIIEHKLLKMIDISQCSNIQRLDVWKNQLENLDLTNCKNLKYLNVNWNSLSQLNLNDCVNLEDLSCGWNSILELDLTNCTKLVRVNCWENQMSTLFLNAPNTLVSLDCEKNLLSNLSVKGYTVLESLSASENQLESIDFTDCPVLKYVYVRDNILTSIDITGCNRLTTLYCHLNRINSEIPVEFDRLTSFIHSPKYLYRFDTIYETNEFGWWYPGEPESGIHKRQ